MDAILHNRYTPIMRRLLLVLLYVGLGVLVVSAQEPMKVIGLIIIGADGQPRTFCLATTQAKSTGYDLLVASGLDINASIGSMGAAVCTIDHEGCFYPAEPCFCKCVGGRCSYWAYYYRSREADWLYSQIGATSHELQEGDVELWIWRTPNNEEDPLPDLTWEAICKDGPRNTHPQQSDPNHNNSVPIWGYLIFITAALAALGGVLWRRQHSDTPDSSSF